MLRKRIIPTLLLQDGFLVKSQQFNLHQIVGKPEFQIKRYNKWLLDELILLDITMVNDSDRVHYEKKVIMWLKEMSKHTQMPLTFGGNISELIQIENRIRYGAEKIVINKASLLDVYLIKQGVREFGSQAILAGMDVKRQKDLPYQVVCKDKLYGDPLEHAKKMAGAGAGELFVNFVNLDGMLTGYDLQYCQLLASSVNIPVIICGGAGSYRHIQQALSQTNVSGVAASNMFLFKELSYEYVKTQIDDEQLICTQPS